MRPGVITCTPDAGPATVATIMVANGIHVVIVAPSAHGTPLIVTDRELVRAVLEGREDACASDLAGEPAAALTADAGLEDAVAMMAARYVTHILAIEPSSGTPAGIVSSLDVVAILAGWEPRLARMLRPAPARPSPSARTLSKATVSDVMHPGIATCTPDVELSAVAQIMAEHRVHCVAVAGIDAAGPGGQHFTWGLVEDMDLVLALQRGAAGESAGTIVATAPAAIKQDEPLDRAAALMVERDRSHVVAVGSSGLPVGMVSTLDVARIVAAT
jgi:CBS domain-containing protein